MPSWGKAIRRNWSVYGRNIAAMVETPALYLSMSAHDNLYTRCILMAVPPKDMNAYIDGKLDFVGLGFLKTAKNMRRIFRSASGNA
jgi:ABC-type multidrug transport system ATPase subunit